MSHIVVRKANAIIGASYQLSVDEHRLVLACLSVINQHEEMPNKVTVSADDFQFCFPDVKRTHVYRILKTSMETLADRWINLWSDDRGGYDKLRWLYRIGCYADGQGSVTLSFSPEVSEYLANLREHYTRINMQQVAKIGKYPHSIRFYELFQCNLYKSVVEMTVDEVRLLLDLDKKAYPTMKEFNRTVINQSIDRISKNTNLRVSVESLKSGRVITGYRFTFVEICDINDKE